jgi:hypothetical protein
MPGGALLHPPTHLIHQLWQTFIENVNPLTKLVHIPSLQPAIEKAIANINHVPKGFEALMFSIYSMAVTSLTEAECRRRLGESRATLLPRYIAATKTALSRAKFMSTTSIVVMQALVFYIFTVRNIYEFRAVWALTGLAIRVAEGMGMRIDGTLLGLSPFETEIRRRIWWQLRMHDSRAAELSGQAKFRDFELEETSPKKPANINDQDMYPTMTQAPIESTKPTEMIWCILRSEFAIFATSQHAKVHKLAKSGFISEQYAAMDDLEKKDAFVAEIEDMIETKFLRFCDPSDPLQFMVLVIARCAVNLIQFTAHHPRRWSNGNSVTKSERQFVWNIVLQLLERYNMMQSSPQLRRFAWNVPYFIQWPAIIHLLDTLRTEPLNPDAVKAWGQIDNMYEMNSQILLDSNKPIFVAVGNLCLKAFTAREHALIKDGINPPDPPEYILKLQAQRSQSKAKRETTLSNTNSRSDVPSEAYSHEQPVNSVEENIPIGDDAFWLGGDLEDHIFPNKVVDTTNIDMDAILAQNYGFDTVNDEVINWAQWDAWFGNTDFVR